MSKRVGPQFSLNASCYGCVHVRGVNYVEPGRAGCKIYCDHPDRPGRRVGDSDWSTPSWCPLLVESRRTFGASLVGDVGADVSDAEESYVEAKIRAWLQSVPSERLPNRITTVHIVESVIGVTPSEAARSPAIVRDVAAAMRRLGFKRERVAGGGVRSSVWVLPAESPAAPSTASR